MVLFLAVVIAGFVGLHFWEVHSETVEDDGNYDDFHSIYGLEATGAVSFTNGEEEELTYIYKDDIDTYLLIGTDASGNQTPGIDEEYNGKMADFMGLLVFNKTKKQYRILLLNRDIITDIPLVDEEGKGEATRPMQLCVSHWFGGTPELNAENTVRAVSMLLGDLEIKGYYEMDMEEIQTLNHLLGGVTLTVEDDSLAEVYPEFTKGVTLTLTDEQAEHYVRARMEIGEDFNEYRMHRQINIRALT